MIDAKEGGRVNRLWGAYIIMGEKNKHTQISYFQAGIHALEHSESYEWEELVENALL